MMHLVMIRLTYAGPNARGLLVDHRSTTGDCMSMSVSEWMGAEEWDRGYGMCRTQRVAHCEGQQIFGTIVLYLSFSGVHFCFP